MPPAPQDEDWISELVERLWPYIKAAVEQQAWAMLPGGHVGAGGKPGQLLLPGSLAFQTRSKG